MTAQSSSSHTAAALPCEALVKSTLGVDASALCRDCSPDLAAPVLQWPAAEGLGGCHAETLQNPYTFMCLLCSGEAAEGAGG